MQLQELLQDLVTINPADDRTISGICIDSRLLQPGEVFLAYAGERFDGSAFIPEVIKKGASAILCESTEKVADLKQQFPQTPIIAVPNLHEKVGQLAARFFNYPSKKLLMIGITGTNGKTSSSHFIAKSLSAANMKCGVIGTLGIGFPTQLQDNNLTTPDAVTLQRELARFVDANAKAVAMEVSSHSLMQNRVAGIDFTIAVFTNLTRDHLDYHGTMENYASAKQRLFLRPELKYAVINLDDKYGQQFFAQLPSYVEGIGYSLENSASATIRAEKIILSNEGIKANVHTPWGSGELHSPLMGRFNLSNLLATLAVLEIAKIPFVKALQYISALTTVPGRMQALGGKGKPLVVVDYSHTPDALQQALISLREHCAGKLWCVFGCGGDRDRGKRPIMAQIAERYSDVVIVTNDNPRTESQDAIIAEIMPGFNNPALIQTIPDRRMAITTAVSKANNDDIILVAGKGHEDYQIIGTEKLHFSDVEEVLKVLQDR